MSKPAVWPPARPTLRTLAEATGLGVTTVSRALKDGEEIGKATRERVQRVAAEIGYVPSRAGVRLRTGRTEVLSLVLSPHAEVMGFGLSMIGGLGEALRDSGFELSVTPDLAGGDDLAAIRAVVENRRADGLILSRTRPQDVRVRYLLEQGVPFVTYGRTELATPHASHDFDNFAFAHDAVERLVARGRRRIAIVPPAVGLTYRTHALTGFERAVARSGVDAVGLGDGFGGGSDGGSGGESGDAFGHGSGDGPDSGPDNGDARNAPALDTALDVLRARVAERVRRDDGPDGIVCCGDSAALAALAGLAEAGLVAGVDVDVIGKQTSAALDHLVPPIDTLYEDLEAAGRALGGHLLALLGGASPADERSLAPPERRFRLAASR